MSALPPVQHIIENMLVIPNKQAQLVPFKLNNVQKHLHDNRALRTHVLKFRQAGMTSFIMAWFLVECLAKMTRAVMIAHDREHTEKLLQRVHLFLRHIKGAKPVLSRANDQEIVFPKTNSSFYIGTAGSRQFGRSDTITHLHGSEVAFWKDPKSLTAGLLQAVPHNTGVVIYETTGNGYGTWYHRQFLQALKGDGRYKALFYPYYIFSEYESLSPLSSSPTPEEIELIQQYKMTEGMLQWRREKLEEFEGDYALFAQEYPLTIEEAFRVTGGSLFPNASFVASEAWKRNKQGRFDVLDGHPNPSYHYVFGVDSSGGTGNDYSTLEGLCLETSEQVISMATNTLAPPSWAERIAELGAWFNNAYLVCESNQHGISVIDCLRKLAPYNELSSRFYKSKQPVGKQSMKISDYGFKTTSTTKYPLIGTLQRLLPHLTLYGYETVEQLRGFGETEEGKLGNVEAANDDRVIALALACKGFLRLQSSISFEEVEEEEEKVVGATLDDIRGRIRPVHRDWFKRQYLS